MAGALQDFDVKVAGRAALDLGSHEGGFADSLLQAGAASVTAVDTAYGILNWNIRNDERVIVMERTNALKASFDRVFDIITIDLGWTPQKLILPRALEWAAPGADVLSLVKPQYEWHEPPGEFDGVVAAADALPDILKELLEDLHGEGVFVSAISASPLPGKKGNREFFCLLTTRRRAGGGDLETMIARAITQVY